MAARRVSGPAKKKVAKRVKTPAKSGKVKVPKRKLKLEYVPIAQLRKWKKNPRKNDKAADVLTGMLEEFGFIDPIIATPDNVIRAGHTRLKAAKQTDLKELPVLYVDFGSEEKAGLFAVANNRASEFAEWDENMLADLLATNRKIPDDIMAKMTGFKRQEIDGLRDGWEGIGNDDGEEASGSKDRPEIRCPYCSKKFKLDE